jgi:hypothetical protein
MTKKCAAGNIAPPPRNAGKRKPLCIDYFYDMELCARVFDYENTPGAQRVYLHVHMIYMNATPAQWAGSVPLKPVVDASHVENVLALRQGSHELPRFKVLVSSIARHEYNKLFSYI